MRNITEAIRKSPDYSPLVKLVSYTLPETYFADNIRDYLLSSPQIKINWNNRLGKRKLFESFYVSIENTHLRHLDKDMFEISDKTGFCIAFLRDNLELSVPDNSIGDKVDLILIEHRPNLTRLIHEIYNQNYTGRKIIEEIPAKKRPLENLIPGFCPV